MLRSKYYNSIMITKVTAGNSMHLLLSNDIEQVNQLYQFILSMKRFHEEVRYAGFKLIFNDSAK